MSKSEEVTRAVPFQLHTPMSAHFWPVLRHSLSRAYGNKGLYGNAARFRGEGVTCVSGWSALRSDNLAPLQYDTAPLEGFRRVK